MYAMETRTHLDVVTIILIEPLQALDQQEIDGEP